MPLQSRPFCLHKPLGYTLPGHLQPFSPAANLLRERPILNSLSLMSVDPDDVTSDLVDQGGEDFQIQYTSHGGLPSIELVVLGCPNHAMRKKLDKVTKSAVKHASQVPDTPPEAPCPPDNVPPSTLASPSPSEEPDKGLPTSVSANVSETYRLLKRMPGKPLADSQLHELAIVLSKNYQAFAASSKDYGKVTGQYSMEHHIDTGNAKPVSQRPYRHSRFEEDFLKKLIEELKAFGLIRPSSSPWMSPVVLSEAFG